MTVGWTLNKDANIITFDLIGDITTGWMGIGISEFGSMPGSDLMLVWVDSTGAVRVSRGLPLF